ncbi:uncharacterized protein N7477_000417 [Penicillium maclennaniae]|uniref:uncharacterized protein n=1 Tax=Penicillium maclennaniae TaxID=1343394 RepID=UPI002540FCD5|nr:uncharacterized protein N7477_000417 [Penicillium maclennaniae]KAJ5684072.1 hypothetical protein N7477_000417 [Penicillium maclennaniae]
MPTIGVGGGDLQGLFWNCPHNVNTHKCIAPGAFVLSSPSIENSSCPELPTDTLLIYTGYPTSAIDKHWKELYRVGNSRISKKEAALLPNKTIAANLGADDYLVVISVFHDLHCLDRLRKTLWYFYDDEWNSTYNPFTVKRPDTFDAKGLNGIIHLDHCINIIRQSLQCFSDVTPYVFQWSEEAQAVHAYANVVHTCRNFDKV